MRDTPWGQQCLSDWPLPRPADWKQLVEARWHKEELTNLRTSLDRGRPFGDPTWTTRTATQLNLTATLRPLGRPSNKGAATP
jgi:putative transposase